MVRRLAFEFPYHEAVNDGTHKSYNACENLFINELRAVLDIPEPKNRKDDIIRHHVLGETIEIDGSRVREVKQWIAGLGF